MVYLFIVSLIWAFSFGLIKDNLSGIDSNFVSFARLFVSFLVFLPFIKFRGINRKLAIRLMLVGAVQYGVMYLTYIAAYRYLKAYEVALFTIFTPIYVTLINDFFRKHLHKKSLLAAILAVIGTAIIKINGSIQNTLIQGFLLLQISNLCFAFGQIYYREIMASVKNTPEHKIFGWLYLGSILITGLFVLIFSDINSISLSNSQIMTLIYLGAIASGISFFLWNYGARRATAGSLAVFNNLKIPLAISVSLLFFNEQANIPRLLIGGIIILLALLINEQKLLPADIFKRN